MGPTGVGKTELCKALAEFMFDTEESMIRIDMSEFMEKHSVARLIGAPPGYVGYEEGGYLTEAVRRRPYSVILLDEVEKAHHDVFNILLQVLEEGGYLTEAVRRRPYSVILLDEVEKAHHDVFNILLQVLDDGRLTDGHGRTVDFRNTVIVMTSNLGSQRIQELSGDGYEAMKSAVMEVVGQHFRPEFINRIDDMVVFHPLSRKDIRKIADIQLDHLRRRLAGSELNLEISEKALDLLGNAGFDPVYGARPLKRAIQQQIENPLAQKILAGKFEPGQTIEVSVKDGAFVFN
jgi:ATP-dependent Clp protease ATP-binding subunit ClpB